MYWKERISLNLRFAAAHPDSDQSEPRSQQHRSVKVNISQDKKEEEKNNKKAPWLERIDGLKDEKVLNYYLYLQDLGDGAYGLETAFCAQPEVHLGHLIHQQLQRLIQLSLYVCTEAPVQARVHQTTHVVYSLNLKKKATLLTPSVSGRM